MPKLAGQDHKTAMKTEEQSAVTKLHADLIEALVKAYIDHGDDLQVGWVAWSPTAVTFRLKVHPQDQGKVRGKARSHMAALEQLVFLMGAASGALRYSIVLEDNAERATKQWNAPVRPFDDKALCRLLHGWLDALGAASVRFTETWRSYAKAEVCRNHTFDIQVTEQRHYDYLTNRREHGITVIGCLGTLFRAIGAQSGVDVVLKVVPP